MPKLDVHCCNMVGVKLLMEFSKVLNCVENLLKNSLKFSVWVMLRPLLPAINSFLPIVGLASKISTAIPFSSSTSAAIKPAGPAPIMATFGSTPISLISLGPTLSQCLFEVRYYILNCF